jgi:hypothetical protein
MVRLGCFSIGVCLVITLSVTTTSFSQQQSVASEQSSDQRFPLVNSDHEQVVSFWTSEGGWHSELQLRNNLRDKSLVITPVLRSATGDETALPAITVNPQEVRTLNLNEAIGDNAPHLTGSYGSLLLRYHSPYLQNLHAALMIHDTGHPIAFHIDATGNELDEFEGASREGIWWLPSDEVKDILIVTNEGRRPLEATLTLFDAQGKESTQKIQIGARQVNRYSVRELIAKGGLSGRYGGIRVQALSHAGALDTLHAIYDESAGFSALLKMFDHDPKAPLSQRDFARTSVWTMRAPMLALSDPDPALNFPSGTQLKPRIVIRNTTGTVATVRLQFHWRKADVTGKVMGPTLLLRPYETRQIDVTSLQSDHTLPSDANWTSVYLMTNGRPDEVMAVAASYDETLRYGAQTPFSDQLAHQWEGGQWEYDSMHDSIITAGNGRSIPTQAAFTLFYNQGLDKYELEQTLQPDDQMWIDVGKLIRDRVPDKNGKVLPTDLRTGSYEFRDLTDVAVGSLFEGKVIYDKTFGHVAYGCAACCAYTAESLLYDPFYIPILSGFTNGVQGRNQCDTGWVNISGRFYDWSTQNTAIATTTKQGAHTGVALGSTTSLTDGYVVHTNGRNGCYEIHDLLTGTTNVLKTTVNSADLWDNRISVTLTSTAALTGTLTLNLIGSANTYSFAYGSGAVGAGTYTATMTRTSTPADTYTSIRADWATSSGKISGSLPIKWKVLGVIRHSQYNTPTESVCSGAASSAWTIVISGCHFNPITLKSDFSSQVYLNGTGSSSNYGILKYTPGRANQCAYPAGADDSNTFLQVTSITGSCNKTLDTSSVATYPNPVTDVTTFGCGDNLALITSANAQQARKYPEDYCPSCNSGFNNTNGHIDNYSTNQACSSHAVGNYGNYWTADTYATN